MVFLGHVCNFSISDMEQLRVSEFQYIHNEAQELYKNINKE